MNAIRDRIVELRRVRAGDLRPHPRNWRVHPDEQRTALAGVLAEIGYAGALVARQLSDGALELIDGHLRAETTPEVLVPVLVVDLDEREAELLLAVHDPLAAMAETNAAALADVVSRVSEQHAAIAGILRDWPRVAAAIDASVRNPPPAPTLDDLFQVVVECRDEAEQRELFDRLTAEGLRCKVITL